MIEPAWRSASAWQLHAPPFRSLRAYAQYPRVPVFDLVGSAGAAWSNLRHPNLLSGVADHVDHVVLRYAALDWTRTTTTAQSTLVKWGRQLVDVFALLATELGRQELGTLLRPVVNIDVGGHARVGFLAPAEDHVTTLPADIRKRWPTCDESALVFVVGAELRARFDADDGDLASVIMHACAENPKRRFRTLGELTVALEKIWRGESLRTSHELTAWELFEVGAGWLELNRPELALDVFQEALLHDRDLGQAREGAELARWAISHVEPSRPSWSPAMHRSRPATPPPIRATVPWSAAEPDGLAFERQRDFRRALDLYHTVRSEAPTSLALDTALARCHLALGEAGEAIDCAQRALVIDPMHAPALDVLVAAMLAKRWHEEALRNAERLVAIAPSSGRAHYLLGKALFACGRLPDARDAFDRATQLDSTLLEAQLLRREVERVTGNLKRSVGSQHAPTFDVPPHLAALRDVLVGGDTRAAIEALRDTRYASDADAQLLLARFLAFERRFDAACEVYDALVATSHRSAALVGKASALLELGRPADALAIFEQLSAAADDADAAAGAAADAAEGAARALAQLGRVAEAAAAYRKFIALASAGSDLRVRAAQLWLDAN